MRNSVLICDDNQEYRRFLAEELSERQISVRCVSYRDDAASILFSSDPPAVFITDLRVPKELTQETYESSILQISPNGEIHGDMGIPGLVREVQKRMPDTRIIILSAINPDPSARSLGVFAYGWKGNDDPLDDLARICRLGPLQKNEVDITGKLWEGPLDICSEQAVNQYLERKFPMKREREG